MRRTCNLTFLLDELNYNILEVRNIISINKKIALEIGFKNISGKYTEYDMIYFPLGIFVITNPNITKNAQGITASLQLKDKMCLLNGDCGGVIPAAVNFNEYDTVDNNGVYYTKPVTMHQTILQLVNHWGNENLSNIIINDLDTRIKKVMRWSGLGSIYMIKQSTENEYILTTDKPDELKSEDKVFTNGQDIGYIYTDFIYPGDLVSNPGQTVTSILDKIKNTLGNYEYFYDVNGKFIFRQKQNFLNTSLSTKVVEQLKTSDYLLSHHLDEIAYDFTNTKLIQAYTNTPQYTMVKNDFVVWGTRETSTGVKLPIRFHLAIDSKPKVGNEYQGILYLDEDNLVRPKCPQVYKTRAEFPKQGQEEIFYLDESTNTIYYWQDQDYRQIEKTLYNFKTKDWRSELYLSGAAAEPYGIDSNYYYPELKNEWPKMYDIRQNRFKDIDKTSLDYYLDFIDSNGPISQFSVSNIGRRSKVIRDDKINCLFEPEIPDYVLIEINTQDTLKLREQCIKKNQNFIQVNKQIYDNITAGGHFNSAFEMVKDLLYQYTGYNENINLTTIPIYHLQPNTVIVVNDKQSSIFGKYTINRMTIPFDIGGMMTISATRTLQKL